ncbi:cardiolipin synthase [Arthrobacter castelli]|uniref:cardiolipin synthase n=1 Tax=Arthrobacter castelli TaxID=271431 RepID=UPI0004044B72|nr:cardiolipin synthase [Arthrobacter castelli]
MTLASVQGEASGGFLPAFPDWLTVLLGVAYGIIAVVALGTIPGNRRPSSAMAWILLILFLPYVGVVLFLLIGSTSIGRRRIRNQEQANQTIRENTTAAELREEDYKGAEWLRSVVELNRTLGALPSQSGNSAELVNGYRESIDAMTAEIDKAERIVNVEFYIMGYDEFTKGFYQALEDAHRRGVKVRVLFDHIGSLRTSGYRQMLNRLNEIGLDWHRMLPILPLRGRWRRPDLRNHRKILIVDGRVAFMGSQNVVDPGYHRRGNREWVDLMTRVEGDVVTALNSLFVTDWYNETEEILFEELDPAPRDKPAGNITAQVVPSGPGFVTENNLQLFNTLIYSAQRRVTITSPYFVPDESLLRAVTTAAQRGVAVELFVSQSGDQFLVHHAQRSYYTSLLQAGVRIFLYERPFVLHSKHMAIDDRVAVVGSSNMDMRSFELNLEVSLMLLGTKMVQSMHRVEAGYHARSSELLLEDWQDRPPLARFVDNVARLSASLQ